MNAARRFQAVLAVCAALGLSHGAARADEGDALTRYRHKAIEMRFSVWNGIELVQGGEPVEIGFFGDRADTAFAGSPAALDAVEGFKGLRIGGFAVWSAGLAVLVTEMILLTTESDLLVETDQYDRTEVKSGPFTVMLVAGATLGITGGVMLQGANGYLNDAVDAFNEDLARRISGRTASTPTPRPVVLSWRGAF